jgi:hypothetical protein
MGFFDDVPVPEPEPPRPRQPWELPRAELPGVVQAGPLLLGRTDRAAVAITSLAAYSTGFEIFLISRSRRDVGGGPGDRGPGGPWDPVAARRSLRFGLLLADGTKVIGDPSGHMTGRDAEPAGPVLVPHTFGGRPGVQFSRWWAWPLPPDGPVEFVAEWPTLGIGESRAALDGRLILDAARQSIRLWPEDEG